MTTDPAIIDTPSSFPTIGLRLAPECQHLAETLSGGLHVLESGHVC